MKKRKNLLKTLALCSVVGLGVGYAVVSNQTLTYTETIPVGERAVNVKIIHNNVSDDGLTVTIEKTDKILDDTSGSYLNPNVISFEVENFETEIDVEVTGTIKIIADGEEIPSADAYCAGFYIEDSEFTNTLKAQDRQYFLAYYSFNGIMDIISMKNNVSIVITLTATPIGLN